MLDFFLIALAIFVMVTFLPAFLIGLIILALVILLGMVWVYEKLTQ